jgi:hypothetical protein
MTIKVTPILFSTSDQGIKLLTAMARYPRFIHAEVMTHRDFSRNASSSRAIPIEKLIADLERDIAEPEHWGQNQPGMQAHFEVSEPTKHAARTRWRKAAASAVKHAKEMLKLGVHKQVVNRILEPYTHINVLISSTNWANFFALRKHPDAMPEINMLAELLWTIYHESQPQLLKPGEWHLPYITHDDVKLVKDTAPPDRVSERLLKMSTARCARVSYLTHDQKKPTMEGDLTLYNRLVGSSPLHASPTEHQATPDTYAIVGVRNVCSTEGWDHPEQHGNFRGWIQHRKTLKNERIYDYDYQPAVA